MQYVTFDPETGILTGCYLQDLQPPHETHHLVATEAQAAVWTTLRANAARTELEAIPPSPPAPLDRQGLALRLDDAVAAIYERPTRFSDEYKLREAQAQAYKDSGYAGDPPQQVAAFATPAGMLPTTATDLILAQAAQLRGALAQLGVLRMQKYAILNAVSDADAEAVFDAAMAGVVAIGTALEG